MESNFTIHNNKTLKLLILLLMTHLCYSQVLEVRGNNVVITNGDTTPSTTDFTHFGSVPSGNKFARSFVLKNIGSATLTFPTTATSVKITGTNASEFSITTSVAISPLSLTAGTYLIIEISFNPTSTGLKTATLTIDPSNGSPATYAFSIQGNGIAATASDFVMTTPSSFVPNGTFNYPYSLLYGPDNYLWLTERVGKKINRVNPANGTIDQLIDLGSLVYQTGGQDGLMGMALHPNLGKGTGEDYVYIAYTYSNTGSTTDDTSRRTKIVRYTYSISGSNGSLASPLVLIQGLSGSNDHNSGKLTIGPDNKLYYTIGDQGVNQFNNKCNISHAQLIPTQTMIDAADYSDYEGKVLRLNLDGSIPANNPVINGVRSHIFTYGHRNPQGLVFGKNGTLYSSEHGPKSDDEINILKSGGNYGWPYISGYRDDKNYEFCDWHTASNCNSISFSDYACPSGATSLTESSWSGTFTPPITTLFTIDAGYNFTGGWLTWPTIGPSSAKVYEGFNAEIPNWDNSILMTTLKKGRIYRQKLSADGNSVVGDPEELLYTQNRYRDIAFDPDGKTIYIITDSGGTTSGPSGSSSLSVVNPGTILKFTYSPALVSCNATIPDISTLPTVTDPCAVTLTAPTATNACTGTIIGTTSTIFPITTQGTTTVIWTYHYGNGNSITQNQTVTIDDTLAPVVSTKDITITVSSVGNTTISPNDINNASTDNCGINTMSLSQYDFSIADVGIKTITLTLTDFKGNTASATAKVTVESSLGTTTQKSNLFTIYPIPFDNHININLPNSYSDDFLYIQLYDITGKIIYSKKHKPNNKSINIDNLAHFSNGDYFIYLSNENKKITQKTHLVKKSN